MAFSEKTLEILHANGWTEDRKISTGEYAEKLRQAGYHPHAAALEVLERFGGMTFSFPSKDLEGYVNEFHFDLDRTLGVCDIEDIKDYGECIGTTLCPIGEANKGHSLIAIAEDGRMFGYFNPFISLRGRNYIEAIDGYCLESEPIKRLMYDGNPLVF